MIESEFCKECKIWNEASIEKGYYCGMCKECFDKHYVTIKLSNCEPESLEKEKE